TEPPVAFFHTPLLALFAIATPRAAAPAVPRVHTFSLMALLPTCQRRSSARRIRPDNQVVIQMATPLPPAEARSTLTESHRVPPAGGVAHESIAPSARGSSHDPIARPAT